MIEVHAGFTIQCIAFIIRGGKSQAVSLDGNVCDKVQFSPGLILDCLHVLSPVSTYS